MTSVWTAWQSHSQQLILCFFYFASKPASIAWLVWPGWCSCRSWDVLWSCCKVDADSACCRPQDVVSRTCIKNLHQEGVPRKCTKKLYQEEELTCRVRESLLTWRCRWLLSASALSSSFRLFFSALRAAFSSCCINTTPACQTEGSYR